MIRPKILIVDDESDYCSIMEGYFKERNYDVSLAYTLNEGLSKIDEIKPDILFLDNNLPDGQGWKYVDGIVEKYPQIRIYLISAYRQKSDFATTSSNITVWEKPISLNMLNSVFSKVKA